MKRLKLALFILISGLAGCGNNQNENRNKENDRYQAESPNGLGDGVEPLLGIKVEKHNLTLMFDKSE